MKIKQSILKKFAKAITEETGVQVHDTKVEHNWCIFRLQSMNCIELIKLGELILMEFSVNGTFAHQLPKLNSGELIISSEQLNLVWENK